MLEYTTKLLINNSTTLPDVYSAIDSLLGDVFCLGEIDSLKQPGRYRLDIPRKGLPFLIYLSHLREDCNLFEVNSDIFKQPENLELDTLKLGNLTINRFSVRNEKPIRRSGKNNWIINIVSN